MFNIKMFLVFPSNFSRSNLIDKLASQNFGSRKLQNIMAGKHWGGLAALHSKSIRKKLLVDKILVDCCELLNPPKCSTAKVSH